jgi:hypothetical protein
MRLIGFCFLALLKIAEDLSNFFAMILMGLH